MLEVDTLGFDYPPGDKYNETRAKLLSGIDSIPDQRRSLDEEILTQPWSKLKTDAAALDDKSVTLRKELLTLAESDGLPCFQQIITMADAALNNAVTAYDKAVDVSGKALTKAGLSPEKDVNYGVNPEAAKNKFHHSVNQCENVRNAKSHVDQSKEDIKTAKRNFAEFKQQLDQLKSETRVLAVELLGI